MRQFFDAQVRALSSNRKLCLWRTNRTVAGPLYLSQRVPQDIVSGIVSHVQMTFRSIAKLLLPCIISGSEKIARLPMVLTQRKSVTVTRARKLSVRSHPPPRKTFSEFQQAATTTDLIWYLEISRVLVENARSSKISAKGSVGARWSRTVGHNVRPSRWSVTGLPVHGVPWDQLKQMKLSLYCCDSGTVGGRGLAARWFD